jgi:hypothetical protein
MTKPNPGSPEAVAAGCTCPRDQGRVCIGLWWYSDGCPVHCPPVTPDGYLGSTEAPDTEATGAPIVQHRTRGGKGCVGRLRGE